MNHPEVQYRYAKQRMHELESYARQHNLAARFKTPLRTRLALALQALAERLEPELTETKSVQLS